MGFHEIEPEERSGDSDIRPADGVGVIEAESRADHGQYIGHVSAVSRVPTDHAEGYGSGAGTLVV